MQNIQKKTAKTHSFACISTNNQRNATLQQAMYP